MWKKEISFKRKPKDEAAAAVEIPPLETAAPEQKQSLLKKEISFSRKPKEPKAPKEPKVKAPKTESASLLKKEISFSRKAKTPQEPQPAAAEKPQKQSFLKKDISFSRKKRDTEVDRLVQEATRSLAPSFAAAEPTSETLPTALAEAAVAAMAQAEVQAQAEAEALAQAEAHARALAEAQAQAELQAQAEARARAEDEARVVAEAQAEADAIARAQAAATAEAERLAAIEQALAFPPSTSSTPFEPVALSVVPDPEPVSLHEVAPLAPEHALAEPAVAEPPVAEPPLSQAPTFAPPLSATAPVEPSAVANDVHAVPVLPVDDPADLSALSPAILAASTEVALPPVEPVAAESPAPEPWPVAETVVAEPEPWLAPPELPPAPQGAGVVVHPPVASADLPPLPETAAGGPFWKKELSFSRKPKAPKAAKAAKAERAPKEKAASAPFWKKELSFGRKAPAAELPVETAVAAVAPVSAPSVPFWKKGVSLKRKPRTEQAVAAEAPTATLPSAPAVPFWKKGVSFSMPSIALPRRGGASGGHAAKKLVGLKIGSSQLAAARVSNNGVAEVQQLVRESLPPGIVVGGELRDPEALGEALKGFFGRNKLPRKGVRIGIASNRIGVRIFDIVGVTEDKQLANAIHFRAQETLPIPLDEAVLDFRVLDESVDAEGQTVKRVLLVVVYRELVERYISACKKAGIQLAGIDLEAFALLRSLAAPADRGSSALVGVAIGYDRSTFAVSDGRVCEFTRVLDWGGSAVNVALARTFDSTPSEVEAIKRSLSLEEGAPTPPGLTEEQTVQALDAVRRQVQSFARELVSSLQFYQNQPGSLGIGEIVLTGGTTHMPGLAPELERLIGVHVRVGDPFSRVKISKRLAESDQSGSLAVAIGLGIED